MDNESPPPQYDTYYAELDLPPHLSNFFDAVNQQDEVAFLDSFRFDGVVDDWGRVFTGRGAIKGWSDKQLIGAHGFFTPERMTSRGDAITVTGYYQSDHVNGLNAFKFRSADDGLISVTIRKGWRIPHFVVLVLEQLRGVRCRWLR